MIKQHFYWTFFCQHEIYIFTRWKDRRHQLLKLGLMQYILFDKDYFILLQLRVDDDHVLCVTDKDNKISYEKRICKLYM